MTNENETLHDSHLPAYIIYDVVHDNGWGYPEAIGIAYVNTDRAERLLRPYGQLVLRKADVAK